jgi:hypothetical protein
MQLDIKPNQMAADLWSTFRHLERANHRTEDFRSHGQDLSAQVTIRAKWTTPSPDEAVVSFWPRGPA